MQKIVGLVGLLGFVGPMGRVALVGLVSLLGLLSLVGLMGLVGLVGLLGPIGLLILLGLAGLVCQPWLFLGIYCLFHRIQKYFQMEIGSLMVLKNLMYDECKMFRITN